MVVGVLVIKGMDFKVAAGGICSRGVMFSGGPLASMLLGGFVSGLMTMREETQLPGGEPAAAVDIGDG